MFSILNSLKNYLGAYTSFLAKGLYRVDSITLPCNITWSDDRVTIESKMGTKLEYIKRYKNEDLEYDVFSESKYGILFLFKPVIRELSAVWIPIKTTSDYNELLNLIRSTLNTPLNTKKYVKYIESERVTEIEAELMIDNRATLVYLKYEVNVPLTSSTKGTLGCLMFTREKGTTPNENTVRGFKLK